MRHLPGRRRDAALPALHRPRRRRRSRWSRPTQGAGPVPHDADARGRSTPTSLELDLGTVEPSLAGPKRPQDRVRAAATCKTSFARARCPALRQGQEEGRAGADAGTHGRQPATADGASTSQHGCGGDRRHHQLHQHLEPVGAWSPPACWPRRRSSRACTSKPWVKTSLAPGSKVVTEYLDEAGLTAVPRAARLQPRRLRLHDLHRQQRPAARRRSRKADRRATTWSSPPCSRGNRNFEGRINSEVRANYLASPPLVVAYALAGTHRHRPRQRAARQRHGRQAGLPARHLADARRRSQTTVAQVGHAGDVPKQLRRRLRRRRALAAPRRARRATLYAWDADSHLRQEPAVLRRHDRRSRRRSSDIHGARVLAVLGDSVTTDHISPAGSIKATSPAGKYLIEHGVAAEGLQLLRRAARQPRGDGARHVRQHPPAQPAGARHRGRLSRATCPTARRCRSTTRR